MRFGHVPGAPPMSLCLDAATERSLLQRAARERDRAIEGGGAFQFWSRIVEALEDAGVTP